MITKKEKLLAWIRAMRIKFILAYIVLGVGGLIIGTSRSTNKINYPIAIFSFLTIFISAIGIHFRDEEYDWKAGFDKEGGGVGVIREGLLEPKPLRIVGWIFTILSIIMCIVQVILAPLLLIIAIPLIGMIIGANFITERIFLGHELGPAFSYTSCFLWVYMAQNWIVLPGIIWFCVFLFLIIFVLVPYQDIGDFEADKSSGKKTLTVKMGIDGIGQFMIIIAMLSLIVLYISIKVLVKA